MDSDAFYRPLNIRFPEIRILELKAASRDDAPLECKLRHADLRTAEYAALSYSWGLGKREKSSLQVKNKMTTGEAFRAKLLCHGKPKLFVEINSNLSRALRCLRRKDRSIHLWTDKICINQDDRDEKPGQIALMRDIYAHATIVHAWLGPSCDELGSFEDEGTIRNIYAAFGVASKVWALARGIDFKRKPSSDREWLETCFAVASDDLYKQTRVSEKDFTLGEKDATSTWTEFSHVLRSAVRSDTLLMRALTVFQDLSNLKWFSRIWILQEYGRAKSLVFHYGSLKSEHLPVFLALSLANSLRPVDKTLGARSGLQDLDKRFLACLTARTTCTEQISVDEVLQAAFNSPPPTHEATDPRDLIHARLGLASDQIAYPGEITRYFAAPNSSTDPNVPCVFVSVARHLLSTGFTDALVIFKPYDFLRGPPDHLLLDGAESWKRALAKDWILPSWAYEWSKDGLHTFTKYSAGNGTQPSASFVEHPNAIFGEALVMHGVPIGTIRDYSRRFSEYVLEAELGKGAIVYADLHTEVKPLAGDKSIHLGSRLEALHRELRITPSDADLERLFSSGGFPAAGFWCWWTAWVNELQRLSTTRTLDASTRLQNIAELLFREASAALQRNMIVIEDVFGTTGDLSLLLDLRRWSSLLFFGDNRMRAVGVELAETFFRSAWGMRVAMLDTGRLCYVPEDSSREDVVVVFYGVKAPLVLHSEDFGETYSIVGPAHVVGVMQGDTVRNTAATTEYKMI